MTISYIYSTSATSAPDTTAAAYKSANRFKIGGKVDLPLTNIGNILSKNDFLFSTLRSARITELGKLNALPTSGLSDAEQSKSSAFARLTFTQTSTRLIKNVKADNSAKADIAAVNYTLKDLSQAVTDYIKARNGGATTAEDDAKFTSAVTVMASSYSGIISNLHGRLAGEGVAYSLNYNQSKKYLAAINTGLAALAQPPVAAAPAEDAASAGNDAPPGDDPSVVPVDDSANNPDAVDITV